MASTRRLHCNVLHISPRKERTATECQKSDMMDTVTSTWLKALLKNIFKLDFFKVLSHLVSLLGQFDCSPLPRWSLFTLYYLCPTRGALASSSCSRLPMLLGNGYFCLSAAQVLKMFQRKRAVRRRDIHTPTSERSSIVVHFHYLGWLLSYQKQTVPKFTSIIPQNTFFIADSGTAHRCAPESGNRVHIIQRITKLWCQANRGEHHNW